MRGEFAALQSLREALGMMADGRGASGALVVALRDSRGTDQVARETLLGKPPRAALRPLLSSGGREAALLASLVAGSESGDSELMGRRGEELSRVIEGWLEARAARQLEQRVLAFRGLLVSAVLGGLCAMVSTLAPLLGGLPGQGGAPPDIGALQAWAGTMAVASASMLGLFTSRRGAALDAVAAVVAFILVASSVGPLAALAPIGGWGVK